MPARIPVIDPAAGAFASGLSAPDTGRRLRMLVVLAVLTLVVVIAGGVGLSMWHQRTQVLDRTTQDAQNLVRVIEEQARGSIIAVDVSLAGLVRSLPLMPEHDQAHHEGIHALLKAEVALLPFVRAIWVTNAQGDMVHDSDNMQGVFNFSKRAYFVEQRDDPARGLYLGPPIANDKGVWFISASRRLTHPDGRFAGVVVAAIEPRYFEQFFSSVAVGQTGVINLLAQDMTLFARYPVVDAMRGKPVGMHTPIPQRLPLQDQGTFMQPSFVDGLERIFAYRKVAGYPLVMLVALGRDEALAPWVASSRVVALAAAVFSLLIAGLGSMVLRELGRSRELNATLRAAKQRAQHSERDTAALLDAIPDLMFDVGIDGTVHDYRAHQLDLLAAPPSAFMGHKMHDFLPPEAATTCLLALQEAHAQGLSTGHQIELDVPGGRKWFELSVARKQGGRADTPRFVMLSRDVTERRAAQNALESANRELARSNADLEQFAYAASHDLIEPLRSVTGSVQLLQKRYGGQLDVRADEFIAHAVGGCQRMLALITDLLTYSRLNTETQQPTPVDVEVALATACSNLSLAIAESQAQITHDPLPRVTGDGAQMVQLLQNLIGNALKFRGDRPASVHVGVRQVEQEWVFSVADHGIGIAPEHFARIFELFKRLHTREEYPGTGVGLTLCRKIVERHGGRIWIESEPGQGSTFFWSMPVDR